MKIVRILVLSVFFLVAFFSGLERAAYACDTMVALPDATATGATILGKNSDRPIYDCQPLMINPKANHAPGETLKLEYHRNTTSSGDLCHYWLQPLLVLGL